MLCGRAVVSAKPGEMRRDETMETTYIKIEPGVLRVSVLLALQQPSHRQGYGATFETKGYGL